MSKIKKLNKLFIFSFARVEITTPEVSERPAEGGVANQIVVLKTVRARPSEWGTRYVTGHVF